MGKYDNIVIESGKGGYASLLVSTKDGDTELTANRGAVPYSVFLDPPLSRVGLTEAEAKAQGYDVKVARHSASAIPKAKVIHPTISESLNDLFSTVK